MTFFVQRTVCPNCHSSKTEQLYSCSYDDASLRRYLTNFYASVGNGIDYTYLQDAQYILNECTTCGLIYQEYIPNDELMEILYERWIDPQVVFKRHEEEINTVAYYAKYAQEVMQMLAYFDQMPSQIKVLDAGMGWGKWARMAKSFGCDVYGNELSPARIEYAESHGIRVLSWEEIVSHQFDFINADQVFEHLPNPADSLAHLADALKPTGLIHMSVPDGHDIKRRLNAMEWIAEKGSKNSLNLVSPLEHINCFNHGVLIKLAMDAGLHETRIPLSTELAFSTNWALPKQALKNIVNPLRQRFGRGGTNLFFRHGSFRHGS